MNSIFLCAMLVILQATPPTPGRTATSAGQSGADSQKDGQKHKDCTPPIAHVEPQKEAVSTDNHGKQVTPNDSHKSVELTRIPPITIVKEPKTWKDHLFDWGPWVFSLLLVGVGAWQVWLLFRTLGAIGRQADIMDRQTDILKSSVAAAEESSKAARDTIELTKIKERGRIVITPISLTLLPTAIAHYVQFTIALHGLNDMLVLESGVEVQTSLDGNFVNSTLLFPMSTLPEVIEIKDPKRTISCGFWVDSRSKLTSDEISQIHTGILKVRLYGFLRYEDVFGDEDRIGFDFRWIATELKNLDGTPFGYWHKQTTAVGGE